MSNPDRPLIYAHRGASVDHLENTLPAFLAAREQGSDWVELDVHLASDGGLVIVHDPNYADGRQIDEHPADERPGTVPLLGQALDACAGMAVNIEIKVPRPDTDVARRVVQEVQARRSAGIDQDICISSFDEATLHLVRAADPAIATAQLVLDLSADQGIVERAAAAGAVAVNPWDPFVDRPFLERCHGLGLAVNAWTVDDRDRIIELAALGVDGIITNVPGLARGYLA